MAARKAISARKKPQRQATAGRRSKPDARIGKLTADLAKAKKSLREARVEFDASTKARLSALAEANEHLEKKIVECQRTEEALQLSEKKYRGLYDSLQDGILMTDMDGSIMECNGAYREMLGYAMDELRQLTFMQLTPPKWHAMEAEIVRTQILTRGYSDEYEKEYIRKDGTVFPISVRGWLIRDARGHATGMWGIVRDISARRRAEDEKAGLEAQLRQSQKIEAIGQLAGGLAHEFNNMLFVINGYAGLLRNNPALHDTLRHPVDLIQKTGERLAKLTAQILAFSRRQTLRIEIVDLNEVVSDTNAMLESLLGEQVTLRTVLDPALRLMRADPTQIGQVLASLVVNARDAMPEGGTLTVETANVALNEAHRGEQLGLKPGPYVMLAVSDTGCGMDDNVKSHLFEPFFTTKEPGHGTGLGLASVHGIVKQSGGHIGVSSKAGKGTTFRVYFPQAEQEAPQPEMPPPGPAPRGTETILVVDDDAGVCALVETLLESKGYAVLTATSGTEALAACERHKARVHLVIADVVMPEMSGPELVLKLHRQRPGIRVLFMSGYKAPVLNGQGLVGANEHFLQKPINLDVLARKVRDVLDEGR